MKKCFKKLILKINRTRTSNNVFFFLCMTVLLSIIMTFIVVLNYRGVSYQVFQSPANISATFYNVLSPFIAIVAAALTFMAFLMQYRANKEMFSNYEDQRKNNAKQEFEHQFYEMLRIHKENVNELTWDRWSIVESSNPRCVCENDSIEKGKFFYNNKYAFKPVVGREVFMYYMAELYLIRDSLEQAVDVLNKNKIIDFNNQRFKVEKELMVYAYKIFFEGMTSIEESFDYRMKFFFRACDNKIEIMKKIFEKGGCFKFKSKSYYIKEDYLFDDANGYIFLYSYYFLSLYKKTFGPYSFKTSLHRGFGGSNLFEGHDCELNHYYRHLYQMVKIVANYDERVVKYEEKRKYLKMLRAQLTSDEQLMLFFNWLAGNGAGWENEKNHFFTTYRMIHNMDIENGSFFMKIDYPEIIKMVKKENPEYKKYENDYLFEFEDVKMKKLMSEYDRKKRKMVLFCSVIYCRLKL